MDSLIKVESDIRDAFKKAFPFETDYDDLSIYEGYTEYEKFFEKIERTIETDKKLDTVLLTKCRYSVNMHTDKTGIEIEKLDKEVWLIPVTVNSSLDYSDQFIRYEIDDNKTNRNIVYSDILEMNQFDIYKFNAKKPHAYINNSWQYVELLSLWFKNK